MARAVSTVPSVLPESTIIARSHQETLSRHSRILCASFLVISTTEIFIEMLAMGFRTPTLPAILAAVAPASLSRWQVERT
ncbi:hypothetical protein D769_07738 [Cupriavidus sp. HMR-1]|nr:hypothetical protein D769_07738 [Cupriavidus sp. HMR-1]